MMLGGDKGEIVAIGALNECFISLFMNPLIT